MPAMQERPTPSVPRTWPWMQSTAIFHPAGDILDRGLLEGPWTQAREQSEAAPHPVRHLRRIRDDRGNLKTIESASPADGIELRIDLTYDTESRLIELHQQQGSRTFRLAYAYDRRGNVAEETCERRGVIGEPFLATAVHARDESGTLRNIEVRDDRGRIREVHHFGARGETRESRSFDAEGRLESKETARLRADGRPEHVERVRLDPRDGGRPVSRHVDDLEYDAETGVLLRRMVIEQVYLPDIDPRSPWSRIATEIIEYDQTAAERPARDLTIYYDPRSTTGSAETHRLRIEYRHDDLGRLVERVVVEQTRAADPVRRRTMTAHLPLSDRRETRPDGPELGNASPADRLVVHEYGTDGISRRRSVYEEGDLLPMQVTEFD